VTGYVEGEGREANEGGEEGRRKKKGVTIGLQWISSLSIASIHDRKRKKEGGRKSTCSPRGIVYGSQDMSRHGGHHLH
jgi:hypothetical protein